MAQEFTAGLKAAALGMAVMALGVVAFVLNLMTGCNCIPPIVVLLVPAGGLVMIAGIWFGRPAGK